MASSCPSRATFNLPLFSVPLEAHLSGAQWGFPGPLVSSWVWQGMTGKGQIIYSTGSFLQDWQELVISLHGRFSSQRDQCYRTFTFQIQITVVSFHLVGPGWYRLSTTYLHCYLWLPYTITFGNKSSFNGSILNIPFVPGGNFLYPLTPIHPSEQSKSHHL